MHQVLPRCHESLISIFFFLLALFSGQLSSPAGKRTPIDSSLYPTSKTEENFSLSVISAVVPGITLLGST